MPEPVIRRRSLAFMACPPEDFASLLARLQRIDSDSAWHLIAFYPPPCELPRNVTVTISGHSVRLAVLLWTTACVRRLERVVVCCRDLHSPGALHSLLQFVSLFPVSERFILDAQGATAPIPAVRMRTLLLLLPVPALLAMSAVVTKAGLWLWPRAQGPTHATGNATAIVVPILPDLSHTFVYREVLELKRRHPEYLVFWLEQGDASVVHREAAELMAVSIPVKRPSLAAYLLSYLAAWIRRPAAMSALIRYLQPHTASFTPGWIANDSLCFLRLEYFHHSNYLSLGFVLAECLRKRHVRYVHVYGSTYSTVRTLVAHRLLGIPFSVSTFVDFDYVTPFHMLREKFGSARFVVACSAYCNDRLRTRLPDLASRFRVLPPALPANYASAPVFRPPDGRRRLVYVGRFVPKKGIDTVIRACALLRDWSVAFTCHLYGAGETRAQLETLVSELALEDRVTFEGPIPNERFYSTLDEGDLFVSPCRYMDDGERDGIPVTFLEAMAAGITVVSTPVSGIPELLVDGFNGYLVPPDSPVALAERLRTLLLDGSRRASVGEAARRTIAERFTVERTVDLLDEWITRETASAGEDVAPATVPARDGAS